MRIGSMTTRQLYGQFGDKDATCGIGAAQVAFGDDPGSPALIRLLNFPVKTKMPCGHSSSSMGDAIIHLNDSEQWPRQQIADWLESEGL